MINLLPLIEECKRCIGASCKHYQLVPIPEVANKFSVCDRTIDRESQRGKLPRIFKIGHNRRICINGVIAFRNYLEGRRG